MISILMAIEAIEEENERELVSRLYSRYSSKVKAIAYKIMRNNQDAEDALGNTFIKIIKYRNKFIGIDEDETNRLIVIFTRSTCFDMLDKRDKLEFISLNIEKENDDRERFIFETASDTDIESDFMLKETVKIVTEKIKALPMPAKDIMLMKYYFNMQNTEIADMIGMNASTVGTIIQRNTIKLKKEMEVYLK